MSNATQTAVEVVVGALGSVSVADYVGKIGRIVGRDYEADGALVCGVGPLPVWFHLDEIKEIKD